MTLKNIKIGVLIESDFYEKEIFYYQNRFKEEEIDLHFLTRLWGQERITFKGHEYKVPFECSESFEKIDDNELASYSAIIVPSGIVADRLRYTQNVYESSPACQFLRRAFQNKNIIKGIICHGMWLVSPIADVIKGRNVVVHNNLYSDALHMGANYVDQDVVIDEDLVTARTGDHAGVFVKAILQKIEENARVDMAVGSC